MPGNEESPQPQSRIPPTIEGQSPLEYSKEAVGNERRRIGVTVFDMWRIIEPADQENVDPLRGCRYVAAMDLSHENPRTKILLLFARNLLLFIGATRYFHSSK